jgi:phospholipid/cholesterol/gamma-HCH transport system substrate-binding protein
MRNDSTFEILIGGVVLLVAFLFFLLVLNVSKTTTKSKDGYSVIAEFHNAEGIVVGSSIKIGGVKVGNVIEMRLNKENYNATLVLDIENNVNIPVDSIFKISSSGLMGDKYVNVKIGADEVFLKKDSVVEYTESAMDLEDLISRFALGNSNKE